jgi:hypothetical protein
MHTSLYLTMGLLITTLLVSAHGLISIATGGLGGNEMGLDVVAGGVHSQADLTLFKAGAGALGATTGVRYPIILSIQQNRSNSKF